VTMRGGQILRYRELALEILHENVTHACAQISVPANFVCLSGCYDTQPPLEVDPIWDTLFLC